MADRNRRPLIGGIDHINLLSQRVTKIWRQIWE